MLQRAALKLGHRVYATNRRPSHDQVLRRWIVRRILAVKCKEGNITPGATDGRDLVRLRVAAVGVPFIAPIGGTGARTRHAHG